MTIEVDSPPQDLKILPDWDEVLHILWKNGQRNWGIYTTERFRKFWDIRVREKREKNR